MNTTRRQFLSALPTLAAVSALPGTAGGATSPAKGYPYLGRADDFTEFRIIEPGLTIEKVESWARGSYGLVRLTTNDGRQGWGQLSPHEAETSALILHRQVAPVVLGRDPAHIDALVDAVIDANMKFPWSYVCRALAGVDTAIWDLYGKVKGKPVCVLLGGKTDPFPVYGSSMRRDISPAAEGERLRQLRDARGFTAFKVRVGSATGHDRDASPGRTEALIPAVRQAVGADVRLMADGNSCFTPPKAIEVGRRLEDRNFFFFEEPCPYWELEWTAEVAAALKIPVSGGEQDNDLAQRRRMLRLNAVDIAQPDLCYVGGLTRAWRVARLAAGAGKKVVPHSANLSLVTLFAMHLMAAIPNAGPFIEFSIEDDMKPAGGGMFQPHLEVREGKVKFPEGPGWGVEINPDWLAKADYKQSARKA